MANKKEWYENLIGKEIASYVDSYETSETVRVVVTGMSYDLGLTLQYAKDCYIVHYKDYRKKNDYHYCLRGPATPLGDHTEMWRAKRDTAWRKKIAFIAGQIRKGYFDSREIEEALNYKFVFSGGPSADTCPFSQ